MHDMTAGKSNPDRNSAVIYKSLLRHKPIIYVMPHPAYVH